MTTNQGAKLKHPTGWFAAGQEVVRASGILSDGAFRLYIHLCLSADRSTGRLRARQADLARTLQKSRRSVVTYLEELRTLDVCTVRSAVNQHAVGEIEICDAFWPYERMAPADARNDEADYTEQVRRLFQSRRCVESPFSPADQKLAAGFFRQQLRLEQIETALLLGCARKYVAMLNGKISGRITSLAYFQAVVDEVGKLQMSADYIKYLRQRVARLEEQWLSQNPARVRHQA
jgi:helix-turn-helix protein